MCSAPVAFDTLPWSESAERISQSHSMESRSNPQPKVYRNNNQWSPDLNLFWGQLWLNECFPTGAFPPSRIPWWGPPIKPYRPDRVLSELALRTVPSSMMWCFNVRSWLKEFSTVCISRWKESGSWFDVRSQIIVHVYSIDSCPFRGV